MLKIYNREEFINKIHDVEEIILFGAGKRLKEIETFFVNTEISKKVSKIVDNNKSKQGSKIKLWEKTFELCCFHREMCNASKNQLILVTIVDYGELLDGLLEDASLNEIEIVCFSHILALQKESKSMNKELPGKFRLEKIPMIPKKIHYCWFGKNPIPDKYKRYMESWYTYCPDYEIIEWNESNYDISKNKYMYDAYQNRVWGFVPDYARIDIVYTHGGIYLDTDVELIKNIDDLLYQKGFAGFEDEEHVNLGSGFGAVKGLPILKAMMDDYDKENFVNEDQTLNLTASPIHNTSTLQKYGLVGNGEYQRIKDMTIYPAKVLTGKSMYTMRTVTKPWTYAIHHYDGSWATEQAHKVNARMEQDMRMYHSEIDGEL